MMRWEYRPLRYDIFKQEDYKDVIYKGKNIFPAEKRVYILNRLYNIMYSLSHSPTKKAIETIVDNWFQSKKNLILLLSANPLYNGNFQIVETIETEKRIQDREVVTTYKELSNLIYQLGETKLSSLENIFRNINGRFYDTPVYIINCINDMIKDEKNNDGRTLQFSTKDGSRLVLPRLLNKLFCWEGENKIDGYNKAFDRFSQAITPGRQTLRRVLSANLIDYITMSCGNSWTSCHTVDTDNKFCIDSSRSYHGAYCSGTLSYGLDKSSLVLYEIAVGKSLPEEEGKIFRNMIHYHNGEFIQGRVYPQDEDSSREKYIDLNGWVRKKLQETTFLKKKWSRFWGTRTCDRHSCQFGTHYRDISCFKNSNYNKNKKKRERTGSIMIGHNPICVHCGKEHTTSGNMFCDRCNRKFGYLVCEVCKQKIDPNERVVYDYDSDGNPVYYCGQCAFFCELCKEVHIGSHKNQLVDKQVGKFPFRWVCDKIKENDDYFYCCSCKKYHKKGKGHIEVEYNGEKFCFCSSSCAWDLGFAYIKNKWRHPDELIWCEKCGSQCLKSDMNLDTHICKECENNKD